MSGLLDRFTEIVGRRAVLQRMAQGAAAFGLALVGVREAEALVTVLCCHLCKDPSTCTYNPSNCACEWCWTCCYTDGCIYACDECFSSSGSWCNNQTSPGCPCINLSYTYCPTECSTPGNTGCANNTCSRVRVLDCPPPPPPPPPMDCGCETPGCCGSPIIIDVNGTGYHLTDVTHGVSFDFFGTGRSIQMSWTAPGVANAFLVLPATDGLVHSGKQLFGNITPQPTSKDPNGFRALAVYDQPENGGNGDGVIDSRDAIFSSLRLWIDANHDGICQQEELHTLPSLGVYSIDLRYHLSGRRDQYGNQFRFVGTINEEDPNSSTVDDRIYDVMLRFGRASLREVRP